MSGLVEGGDTGEDGGLQLDEEVAGGGLLSDEFPNAYHGAKAKPTAKVVFGFASDDLHAINLDIARQDWRGTARILGFASNGVDLLAGRLDPQTVSDTLVAFVGKRGELERKGQAFAHLKKVATTQPHFAKWFERIQEFSKLTPAERAYEELVAFIRQEFRTVATHRAKAFFENDNQIDFSEWSVLLNEVRSWGLNDSESEGLALDVCRTAVGQPGWTPPPPPDDAAARAKEAEEQRKLAERTQAAETARAERAKAEALKEELRHKAEAERNRGEEERRKKAEAERQSKEEDRRRAEAEKEKLAEEARAREAEAETEKARAARYRQHAEEEERARESARAAFSGAVRGLAVGAIVSLVVALVSGMFSGDSAAAVAAGREHLAVGRAPDAVRALCKAAESPADEQWVKLKAEIQLAAKNVPIARERERVLERWNTQCAPPTGATVAPVGGKSEEKKEQTP